MDSVLTALSTYRFWTLDPTFKAMRWSKENTALNVFKSTIHLCPYCFLLNQSLFQPFTATLPVTLSTGQALLKPSLYCEVPGPLFVFKHLVCSCSRQCTHSVLSPLPWKQKLLLHRTICCLTREVSPHGSCLASQNLFVHQCMHWEEDRHDSEHVTCFHK